MLGSSLTSFRPARALSHHTPAQRKASTASLAPQLAACKPRAPLPCQVGGGRPQAVRECLRGLVEPVQRLGGRAAPALIGDHPVPRPERWALSHPGQKTAHGGTVGGGAMDVLPQVGHIRRVLTIGWGVGDLGAAAGPAQRRGGLPLSR